jgi:hypothetical protein
MDGGMRHEEDEEVIVQWTLTMSGRNRIAFKRLGNGTTYVEILRAGELVPNGGWLVVDSGFVEAAQLEKLREILRPAASDDGERVETSFPVYPPRKAT